MNTQDHSNPPETTASTPSFQDRVASQAASFFCFYWLFRWCWPEILPQSLQQADLTYVMLACYAGGFLFALPRSIRMAADDGARVQK